MASENAGLAAITLAVWLGAIWWQVRWMLGDMLRPWRQGALGRATEPAEFRADPAELGETVRGWTTQELIDGGVEIARVFVQSAGPPMDPATLWRGLAMLELALERPLDRDQARAVGWVLALGYRRSGSHRRSARILAGLRTLSPEDDGVASEYVLSCLLAGQAADALPVARELLARQDDADRRSNLAVTLLLSGRVLEALQHAERALVASPGDATIVHVHRAITEVATGLRERPTTLAGLSPRSTEPEAVTLGPDEARDAWREAITAYRAVLQTQGGHILPSEAIHRIEAEIGTIAEVAVEVADTDICWRGRSVWGRTTERATFVGERGGAAWQRAVHLGIEQRQEGWRVVQVWPLPTVGQPASAEVVRAADTLMPGPSETIH